MMVFKTLLPAAGISILAASPCAAQTANAPAVAPAVAPEKAFQAAMPGGRKFQVITLRFVRPSLMAHWLDPANHRLSREFGPGAEAVPKGLKTFSLPEGVDRVVAIDPQNTLLVLGTTAGAQKVREIAATLDKPQRRVTLEVRLVTVQSDKLSGLWADLAARTTPDIPAVAPLGARDEQILGEQLLRLQARIESVRSLTVDTGVDTGAAQLEFNPPSSTNLKPEWMRGFSSAMPVIPPPFQTDDMIVLGRGLAPVLPVPPSLLPAPFEQIRLQISPTLGEQNLITFNMVFPARSGAPVHSTELSAGLREGESLALALPATSVKNRAFLLLAAREVPHLEIAALGRP